MRKKWHSFVVIGVCLAAASGAATEAPAAHAPGIYAEVPGKTGDDALVRLRAVMLDFTTAFQIPMNLMPPAKSAEEFALLRLMPTGDARHVQAGKNSPSAVPIAVERLDKNVFHVRPKAALAAGEYAFMWAALASQVWEFGVEP